ncbi:MAG: hypothetical protein K2I70_02740, partial [Bacilli bacterium]|nr:hypothetical protein [Bacilli bacterium]
MEEKKIIEFYEAFAELLIHTPNLSDKIFCEFVNALLCGHELESSGDCSLELYEYILTYNTIEASNRQLGKSDEITFFPFSIIDTSHYKNVVKKGTIEDILNYRRTLFLNRLSSDLDNNNEGYIYEILARHNPSYIEIYNLWTKIRDVIRKGWLNRRVSYLYAESDSTHSIQMLALASVCMHIYNLDYLDKQ